MSQRLSEAKREYLASEDGSDVEAIIPHARARLSIARYAGVGQNVGAFLRREWQHLSQKDPNVNTRVAAIGSHSTS